MKRFMRIILLVLVSLTLVSCNNEKGAYKFVNLSKEYKVKNSSVDLHFEEDSNIAYISVEKFIKMLDGVYYSKEFEFLKDYDEKTLTINLDVEYEDEQYVENMVMNVNDKTITVSNLDFFSLYMRSTETDYGEGLVNLEPIVVRGDVVVYELDNYNFEMLLIEKEFYLPLFLINLIFNQDNYFDVYFNGETLYGVDTSDLDEHTMRKIMKSKNNALDMPEDIKEASYYYYLFVTDYFYGLKAERNIESGAEFINKENFLSGDVNRNIFQMTKRFDDLHTGHIAKGFYNNDLSEFNYDDNTGNGPFTNRFYAAIDKAQGQAVSYFGIKGGRYIDVPDFEIINGDTAVIYLMGFDVDTPKEVEAIIEELDETVINIIFDLTLNTGGNLGAVLRIFTLMTNEEIWYHMKNTADGATASYGVVGEKPAYDQYTYFIKSSGVTFSAANLMVSIARELDIKVIGTKSSGGASPISFIVFPNGSIINISGTAVLADQTYKSIELGLEPDYELKSLYSKTEIRKAIRD